MFAFAVLAATVLASSSARAANGIAACAEAGAVFATVEAIGARDGMTIRLADGREIRLAGVMAATVLDGDAEAVRRATAALDALIAGRRIALHGRTGGEDRYGRIVAQVTIAGETAKWIQAELVALGMLRAAPATDMPACAEVLLARERRARAAGVGLWADDRFAIETADSVAALTAAAGRFAIVEGTVRRIGEAGGRLFLDFGRRYTEDFTVIIPRSAHAAFAASGIELRALAGRRLRTRGMLYIWGGPALEVKHPAAIELIDRDGV
jgi:endonuclease YncB( thermonuclease family)